MELVLIPIQLLVLLKLQLIQQELGIILVQLELRVTYM